MQSANFNLHSSLRPFFHFVLFSALMHVNRGRNYFFCFLLLLFVNIAMMQCARRTTDLFGAPEPFSGAKLPTFGEVGKQWRYSRQQIESKHPGRLAAKWDIAREVKLS